MASFSGAVGGSSGVCGSSGLSSLEPLLCGTPSFFFRGVGQTLLQFARQRSLGLGYGGRVGLHSLPESEMFYRRLQMPEYGNDLEKEGLVYFEYGVLRR